jgi:uracil phosphoribosyltransferase
VAVRLVEVYEARNPALARVLVELRDRGTPRWRFRQLLRLAGMLLAYEAGRFLPRRRVRVETPLGVVAEEDAVDDSRLVVVAVLRAAVPMALGVLDLYPDASLGFIAATRLEDTVERRGGRLFFDVDMPYWKTPRVEGKHVLLVDPMLATGSTLARAAVRLAAGKPEAITVLSLIAAPQGLEVLREKLQELNVRSAIIVAAVDPQLNDRGFIVPGLGDAGDRSFGEA